VVIFIPPGNAMSIMELLCLLDSGESAAAGPRQWPDGSGSPTAPRACPESLSFVLVLRPCPSSLAMGTPAATSKSSIERGLLASAQIHLRKLNRAAVGGCAARYEGQREHGLILDYGSTSRSR